MNLTSLFTMFTCVLITSLNVGAQTQVPSKEKVARAWYRQFRRIRTLQLNYTSNIRDIAASKNITLAYDFTFSGGKYRAVTTPTVSAAERKKGYTTSSIGIFDGKEYASLDVTDQISSLNVGKKSTLLNSMGFAPLNVSVLFFDESQGDYNWILRMQKQEPWERLAKRIQSIKAGKRNGVDGYWVELPYRSSQVTLFLNQDLYPTYKKRVTKGKVAASFEIQSKKYTVDGNDFFMPTEVVTTITNAKGEVTEIWTEKVTQPVKINQPIKNASSLFTIPRSQAAAINNTDDPL